MSFRLSIVYFIVTLFAKAALAQLDASNMMLLQNSSGKQEMSEQSKREESGESLELDSSRYTIRTGTAKRPPAETKSETKLEQTKKAPALTVKENAEANKPVAPPMPAPSPKPVEPAESLAANPKTETMPDENLGVSEKVQRAVLGGGAEEIKEYRDLLHPNDRRKNLLEISLAPGYLYSDSSSSYSLRSYLVSSPVLSVGAAIWLSPFFGIHSSYEATLGASVKADSSGTDRVAATNTYYDAGLRFRRYFGVSRRSNQISFGVDYRDNQFKVPSDEQQRMRWATQGVRLSMEVHMMNSTGNAQVLGVEFVPSAKHKEKSDLAIKSGESVKTNVVGLWLGGDFNFDRTYAAFWRLRHTVERNNFVGSAQAIDPASGVRPEGVSITNGTTVLSVGFTWGQ